ncbi:MAG: S-layer homology domain-containing protein [Clostridia bacterium]|nr:S-layer homology domain-containing protein [Clostridia bacterium]
MKRKNFSERILAFGVAMTMLLGMSIPVFADEVDSLNSKIANAEEGATITLDKDYTEDVVIPSGKNVTLDLATYTLKGTDAAGSTTIKVEKDATLTLKGEGKVINNSTGNGAACIFNNGTVIIESGTIKKETGNKSYYNIANHGKMTINGGTILNDTPYEEGKSHASLVENGYYDYTSTNPILGYVEGENDAHPSLEINGGTFDGGLNTIKNDDGAILVINDATVKNQIQVAVFNVSEATIHGGTYEVPAGKDKTTVFNRRYNDNVNKGKLKVTGGEFNADYFIEVINNATEEQMGEIEITGGTFNTEKGLVNTDGRVDISTIKISGGVFAQEPSEEKMASDVEKIEKADGQWVVGKKVTLTLKYENESGDVVENYLSGDEVTLPSAEKEGFEFKGWMKDEETTYESGEKIKIEEDMTLTAKWEKKKEEVIESGDTSGDVSGEKENEPSGDVSGEKENEASGEKIDETSGNNSGEKKDDSSSGSHSSGGKKDDTSDEKKEEETKETVEYDDVKSGDWFKTYVDKATEMKLVNGVGNKKFAPNDNITRGMLIEILYRYSKAEEKSVPTFDDVSKDAYYATAIAWAANNKIINGVGNNKFEPDRNITREELSTILYRYVKLQNKDLKVDEKASIEYVDKNEISEFAIEAIVWCTDNKIIEGRGNKEMAPKANTTRAEATTMMVRLAEMLMKK